MTNGCSFWCALNQVAKFPERVRRPSWYFHFPHPFSLETNQLWSDKLANSHTDNPPFFQPDSHLIWLGVLIIVIIIHKEKSPESFDLIAFFCSIVVHFLSGNDTGVFTRYNEFTLGICRAAIMYSKLAELSLEAFKLPKTIFFSLFLRTCAYLRRYFVKVCLMFSVCCLHLLHM